MMKTTKKIENCRKMTSLESQGKHKTLVTILLLGVILCMNLISASYYYDNQTINQSHGVSLTTVSTATAYRGMNITVGNIPIVLVNITKNATTQTNGTAVLWNGTSCTTLASATFIGDTATFTNPPNLSAGGKYAVLVYTNGNVRFKATTYPIVNSYLNWTAGIFNGCGTQNNELNEILTLGVAPLNVSVSPPDVYAPNITIISGNGTNNIGVLNQNWTINFNITDDIALDKCWYKQANLYNNINDGNWSSYIGNPTASVLPMYINYIKTSSNIWRIKDDNGDNNYIIPASCLTTPVVKLKIYGVGSGSFGHHYIYYQCYNSSNQWDIVTSYDNGEVPARIYEEFYQNNISCLSTNINLTTTQLNDNLTLYANDTSGNLTTSFVYWSFIILKNNETYLNQTTEGATNLFTFNTTLSSGLTINQANLIYNGSSYSSNIFSSGNNFLISRNLVIPDVITTTNFSFYWSIRLSDGTIINTSANNQTVYNLSIDNCTLYSYNIYRFNLLDEKTQVALSGLTTIDVAMNVYSQDRSIKIFSFNKSYSSINPANICLGSTILNTTNYSVDIIIRHEKNATHVIEYYNIVNDSLSNSSILQTINLYDLAIDESTDFRLTFTGSDYLPETGALVYLMRQYVADNNFKTVELPKTDANGQAVLHMVRNDVIYNIVVVNATSKQILGTFNNLIAFCEDVSIGKCEINLNAFSTGEEIYNYDKAQGIIVSTPNYDNATRLISFDFVTTSGTPRTVRMLVTRNDIFGNNSVCDNSVNSGGGALSCLIPANVEDTSLLTTISVDGTQIGYSTVNMVKTNLGFIGYFALFVMMISLVFMFASSKEGVLVGLILGVLAGIGLGLLSGTVLGIGSAGIWIIILIIIAFWKLNQGRAS